MSHRILRMLFTTTILAMVWCVSSFVAPARAETPVFANGADVGWLTRLESFGYTYQDQTHTKMDALQKKGLLVSETRKSRLSNTLVIVVAADSTLKIDAPEALATSSVKHLALADPKAVPAGIYAKEFLEKRKLWAAVEGKVVPTENVRAALAAVESGNVEAGMVYRTDAAISKKVKVACQISASEGPAISYPVAVVKGSRNLAAARKFVEYLDSAQAKQVFQNYEFIVLK